MEHVEIASFRYVIHLTYGRSAHWTLRSEQTDPLEPGLYLGQYETASFQYVIHPTYGRSAHWTLRAAQTGPQGSERYLEQIENASFQYVIHPTYGRSAHWTLRESKLTHKNRDFIWNSSRPIPSSMSSSYIWTLCTLDTESGAN
jgi:hypothetical protein